jgi:hypothetical protein
MKSLMLLWCFLFSIITHAKYNLSKSFELNQTSYSAYGRMAVAYTWPTNVVILNDTISMHLNAKNKSIAFITNGSFRYVTSNGFFYSALNIPCMTTSTYDFDRYTETYEQARLTYTNLISEENTFTGYVYDANSCNTKQGVTLKTNKHNQLTLLAAQGVIYDPLLDQVVNVIMTIIFDKYNNSVPELNKTQPPNECFLPSAKAYCNVYYPVNQNYTTSV